MAALSAPRKIHSYTHYLQRDQLYEHVKPYSLRFTAPNGFPRANIKLDRHDLSIADIRPRKHDLSLETDGCRVWDFRTRMTYGDFDDEAKVKDVYLAEIADGLREHLAADRVQIFEHTVRKRHDEFPISTGEPYQFNQPTSIAHVGKSCNPMSSTTKSDVPVADTTTQWVHAMAEKLNPGEPTITERRIQCLNVWKPLRGPVKDWPLALCEPSSLQCDRDLEPCDLVYPDYVVENRQVYHSPELRWFYLSDQREDEAWVFLQTDTARSDWTVAHTSFPLEQRTNETPPRESIEVRALVFYREDA